MNDRTRIIRAAALSLLFVAALEAGLHVHFPGAVFRDVEVEKPDGNYRLSPNPDLVYVPRPNTGEFNRYGHRGEAHPFERRGRTRVVVIGNSAVAAIKGQRPEDRFTEVLERRMPGCEFVNLGVNGYSLTQEVAYLETLGLAFRPEYVLWGICCDNLRTVSLEYWDLQEKMNRSGKNGFYRAYYQSRGDLERWLMRSKLYCYLKYRFSRQLPADFDRSEHLDDAAIGRLLDKIARLERARGFKSIFVLLPANTHNFDDDMQRLRRVFARRGIAYLDYLNAFGRDAFRMKGEDHFHLSETGHTRFAELLEPTLRRILSGANETM